jgi:hypothetical protein
VGRVGGSSLGEPTLRVRKEIRRRSRVPSREQSGHNQATFKELQRNKKKNLVDLPNEVQDTKPARGSLR